MRPSSRSHGRRKEAFHKYLKPGALAQIRDSKISARSQRPNDVSPHSLARRLQSPPTQDQILLFDEIPAFLDKICRGRVCLRRKKLVATRSSSFLLNLNAAAGSALVESSNGGDNNTNGSNSSRGGDNLLINVVHSDVVVAH